jgi:hypothetical protein
MNSKLSNAFATGLRPESKMEISNWVKKNVFLAQSKKSEKMDISLTPWLLTPLEAVVNNDYENIIFVGCTGAGKSTLLEALVCYTVLERPGPLGIFMQSAPTTQQWVETRLLPMLEKNPNIKKLFPSDRHKVKRESILFPHMPLFMRGPSVSNLQSLSLDGVVLDECFLLDNGVIDFAKKRNHDRAFSYMLLLSQPGRTDSDFHRWASSGKQMHYHYKCPNCQDYHMWDFKKLLFDKDLSNICYQCDCGYQIPDNVVVRREMTANGKYLEIPTEKSNPKNITYNFTAGLKWDVSWETLIREFLSANEEAKNYNFELLEKFRNQRLALWWNMDELEFAPIEKSGYSLTDRVKWDKTLMAVDCQGQIGDDFFWYSVMTFQPDGTARLIDFGRLAGYDSIVAKQKEWELLGNEVVVDVAHKADETKDFCARYGYLSTNGATSKSFPITIREKLVNRVYGKIRQEKTLTGKMVNYCPYASNRVKTLCAGLRSSKKWEIPNDIPDYAIKQLNSERLQDGNWIQIKKDNHIIDCYAMTLVLALIHKIPVIKETEELEESNIVI